MTPIDPKRQQAAAKRAADARRDAKYHIQQAATFIAKAEQIERTWELPAPAVDKPPQTL
jgi:type IV secretory pathway VirD2 relaxase